MTTNGNGWKTAALSALGALLLLALTLRVNELSADRREHNQIEHQMLSEIASLKERVKHLEAAR